MKISELIAKHIGREPAEGELFQEVWPDTNEHGEDYLGYGAVFQYKAGKAFYESGADFGLLVCDYVIPVISWDGVSLA